MSISRRNKGAVGEDFDSWIRGVVVFSVVLESEKILSGITLNEVVPGPNPTDPVSFERTLFGFRFGRDAAVGKEEAAVGAIFSGVSIAGESEGEFTGRTPCSSFVFRENNMGVFAPRVLTKEDGESFPIGRANATGLTKMDVG